MTAPASHADLVALVARWGGGLSSSGTAGDSNYLSVVEDSIFLAETDLNDLLRVPEMLKRVVFTATAEFEALPDDLLRVISVGRVVDGVETPMTATSEEFLPHYGRAYAGCIAWYALVGAQFRLAPKPTATAPASIRLTYLANVDPLSASAPCTAVLARYPNAYLYGALKHLAHYTEDDAKQAKWDALFMREIQKANRASVLREATLG
jgi:hypothetical protein